VAEIRNYFSLSGRDPLVFLTSVKEDRGIRELLAGIRRFQAAEDGRIRDKAERMKASYIEKIVIERVQEALRRDPAAAALARGEGEDNPQRAAERILELLKKGGGHDKKD
jgi:putative protein kinase ArgK-like GTPase of G3E family